MPHTCHALGCEIEVPPRLLMHREHWRMIPVFLRLRVLHAYQPGQEITKVTTAAYRQAAALAIISVAEQEGRAVPELYQRMALKG